MAHDYTRVHRDIAAGQMAGDLIKAGYYGKEMELFGSVCSLNGEDVVVYGDDQEAVALKAYEYLTKGATVSHIMTKTYHFTEMNADAAPKIAEFVQELKQGNACTEEFAPKESGRFVWSGFAYEEEGENKTLINGYFPYVFEHYLNCREKNNNVSTIEFCIMPSMNFDREQVKQQLSQALAQ